MNIEKSSSSLRMLEHWTRLPKEAVEFLSVEIFKTQLDTFICNLILINLL